MSIAPHDPITQQLEETRTHLIAVVEKLSDLLTEAPDALAWALEDSLDHCTGAFVANLEAERIYREQRRRQSTGTFARIPGLRRDPQALLRLKIAPDDANLEDRRDGLSDIQQAIDAPTSEGWIELPDQPIFSKPFPITPPDQLQEEAKEE